MMSRNVRGKELLTHKRVNMYQEYEAGIITAFFHTAGFFPITYLLTPCSRVLLEKLTGSAASQEIPRILEPEGSSPSSQVPATCPYPEPAPSSPHNPLPLPEDPS